MSGQDSGKRRRSCLGTVTFLAAFVTALGTVLAAILPGLLALPAPEPVVAIEAPVDGRVPFPSRCDPTGVHVEVVGVVEDFDQASGDVWLVRQDHDSHRYHPLTAVTIHRDGSFREPCVPLFDSTSSLESSTWLLLVLVDRRASATLHRHMRTVITTLPAGAQILTDVQLLCCPDPP